jgi:large-conductance mechanosensitive channel
MKNIIKAFIGAAIIQTLAIAVIGGALFTAFVVSLVMLEKFVCAL